MGLARLQDALERLTTAIHDVETEVTAMKAEHDPGSKSELRLRPGDRAKKAAAKKGAEICAVRRNCVSAACGRKNDFQTD